MFTLRFTLSTPLDWLSVLALGIVLAVQVWGLSRKTTLSANRKRIRIALNGLLWLLLLAFVLQPVWKKPVRARQALVVGAGVPAVLAKRVQDSLRLEERFTVPDFKGDFEAVTLLGQEFSTQFLSRLSGTALRWIPYHAPDQLQEIQWKGILRQGELQRVSGRLFSSEKQLLKLRFASRTLDSLTLRKGRNEVELSFPTFSRGRTAMELVLGERPLDTIRFFTRPTEPRRYRFLLDNPDFESKTLADWLGQAGHSVELLTNVSRNVSSRVQLNRGGKPDILLTDPGNAANPAVKRAVSEGKAVLFFNLSNPEADSRAIDKALGTAWRLRKISNEALVPVGKNLTAWPYAFVPALRQFPISGFPVAVQRGSGTVGLSLLSETFPLKLSGDSLAYHRVWQAILAPLQATALPNATVDAPVFNPIGVSLRFNDWPGRPRFVRAGEDTLSLRYSPFNQRSAEGDFRFGKAGWQSVQDSLEMYVEGGRAFASVRQTRLLGHFLKAHSQGGGVVAGSRLAGRLVERTVPDWVWFGLLLLGLTALWVEPKLRGFTSAQHSLGQKVR